MQKKYDVPIIAVSVFLVAILLNFDASVKPAFSQSGLSRIDVEYVPQATFYQESTGILWVLANGAIGSSDANVYLVAVDPIEGDIIHTKNLYTDMANLNGTNLQDSDLDGQDLWCGITWCYVTFGRSIVDVTSWQNIDLDDGVILLVDATGTIFPVSHPANSVSPELGNILAYYQHTVGGVYNMDGRDDSCDISGCVGGTSLWVELCDEVFNGITCDPKIHLVSGNLDLISFQGANGFPRLTDLAGFSFSDFNTNTAKYTDIKWTGNRGSVENYLVGISGDATDPASGQHFSIFNVASNSLVCGDPSGGITESGGLLNMAIDADRDRIFVGGESGTITVYNYACSIVATYNSTTTGLGTNVKSVLYVDDYDYVIAQDDGVNAHISIMDWNGTLSTNDQVLNTFPSSSQSYRYATHATYDSERRDAVFFPQSTANDGVLKLEIAEPVTTGGDDFCVDTNFNGITDVCFIDVNDDGVPDGSRAEISRANQNITTSSEDILCQVGLLDCDAVTGELDNPDHRTNGVGYLLTLFLLLLVLGFMTFILHRTHTPITEVPYPVWILYVVGVVGASVGLGWIQELYFYSAILAGIVIPATAQIYSKIRGG